MLKLGRDPFVNYSPFYTGTEQQLVSNWIDDNSIIKKCKSVNPFENVKMQEL